MAIHRICIIVVGMIMLSAGQRSPYSGFRSSSFPAVADRFQNGQNTGVVSNMFDGNNLSVGNRLSPDTPEGRYQTNSVGDDYAARYISTWNRDSQPFNYQNAAILSKQLRGESIQTPQTVQNTSPQSQNWQNISPQSQNWQNTAPQRQNWQNTQPQRQNWQNSAPRTVGNSQDFLVFQ